MRALLLALLLAAPAAADWSDAYKEFKRAYRKDAGAVQRKEALLAVAREDVPEAAALLLRVWDDLESDAAKSRRALHKVRTRMREALRKLRDPRLTDARKRQALWARVEELGVDDAGLNTALAAVEIEQAAILAGLKSLKSPAVVEWFAGAGLRKARSTLVARILAERIAAGGTGARTLVRALDGARRADEAIPLLQALASAGGDVGDGIPAVLGHLKHRDWAVRVAAAKALAKLARPEGVGPLVLQLQRERPRSRAVREMAEALTILTGVKLGPEPEHWLAWWRANESKVFEGEIELGHGEPSRKSDQGRFYGIPQVGERILYVLDVSGSMEVSMTNPRWINKGAVAAPAGEDSRFDAAVRELLRATRSLRRDARYAVILYASHVTALHDELVEATPENHAELRERLRREGPGGSTNIYEALDYALRVAQVHPDQPRAASAVDAIYLISDGSPTNAQGEREDPQRTLVAVRSWNAHQRVQIFTIGIGKQHNAGFLRALAEENGGDYWAVKPKKKQKPR